MPNPLFQMLNNAPQSTPQVPANDGGFMQLLQQFEQFQRSFKGDPKQAVMQMLSSGQVSQQQLQQVSQIASQIMQFLPK